MPPADAIYTLVYLKLQSHIRGKYLWLDTNHPVRKAIEANSNFEIAPTHKNWRAFQSTPRARGIMIVFKFTRDSESEDPRATTLKGYAVSRTDRGTIVGVLDGEASPVANPLADRDFVTGTYDPVPPDDLRIGSS